MEWISITRNWIRKTEELGCHLRFDYIPWGDERSQINMAIASGEYDFISNGNFSDYYQQAAKGAFLDLNEVLDCSAGAVYTF